MPIPRVMLSKLRTMFEKRPVMAQYLLDDQTIQYFVVAGLVW